MKALIGILAFFLIIGAGLWGAVEMWGFAYDFLYQNGTGLPAFLAVILTLVACLFTFGVTTQIVALILGLLLLPFGVTASIKIWKCF